MRAAAQPHCPGMNPSGACSERGRVCSGRRTALIIGLGATMGPSTDRSVGQCSRGVSACVGWDGVALSRKRSSSTGNGSTSVEFLSAATSTTV